jgi:hypothetical protein
MPESLREDYRSSYHRAGQSASSGFIDASDADNTYRTQFFFVPKTTTAIHPVRNLKQFHAVAKAEIRNVMSDE